MGPGPWCPWGKSGTDVVYKKFPDLHYLIEIQYKSVHIFLHFPKPSSPSGIKSIYRIYLLCTCNNSNYKVKFVAIGYIEKVRTGIGRKILNWQGLWKEERRRDDEGWRSSKKCNITAIVFSFVELSDHHDNFHCTQLHRNLLFSKLSSTSTSTRPQTFSSFLLKLFNTAASRLSTRQ